jgi:hypothetical protein
VGFALFGPTQDEVDQVAHDLIVAHGLGAYDEAVRLSEIVSLLPHSARQSKLYKLASNRIEHSFATAREKFRERRLADPRVLELIGRLNAQDLENQTTLVH